MSVLPIFVSHYSQTESLLTLNEPGKSKPTEAPSVFDLAKEAGLKDVTLVDEKIDGLEMAYKSSLKAKVKLCYGIKLTVCADASIKDDPSCKTESKVIVFMTGFEGRAALIRIWNRAATDGFYYVPRTDWATLKAHWSPHLILALPFFSSFVAKNRLTHARIVPDLPVKPVIFREVASDLPFAPLIDKALDSYVAEAGIPPEDDVKVKTILYRNRADFIPYMVLRCIGEKKLLENPNISHMNSDSFCLQSYKEMTT